MLSSQEFGHTEYSTPFFIMLTDDVCFKRILLFCSISMLLYITGIHFSTKIVTDTRPKLQPDGIPEKAALPTRKSTRARSDQPLLYWQPLGRLGNLLFEYTSAFCTAVQSNHTPTITDTSPLLSLFKINRAVKVNKQQQRAKRPGIGEKYCCYRQPHILEKSRANQGEIMLSGYLHSFKYMLPCWEELSEELMLQDSIQDQAIHQMVAALLDYYTDTTDPLKRDSNALSLLQDGRLPKSTHTFIGVHIRRTDRTATYPTVKFFAKAFRHFEGKFKRIIFFTCSDDIKWAKKELPSLVGNTSGIVFMSDRTKDYKVDFGVLVNCNHSIVTAGTFSWWSGWLSGGQVIYHTGFDAWKKRDFPMTYKQEDFFPAYWIPMG